MTTQTTTVSLPISPRIIAGSLVLFLGTFLIMGVGFAGDQRMHNGAHDSRHASGFPCH